MPLEFEESGLIFTFEESTCFRIEDDQLLSRLNGVKCCECISTVNNDVIFIEAKSSAPKCIRGDRHKASYAGDSFPENWEIKTNFDQFIENISQKFQDSYFFLKASLDGWHGDNKKLELEGMFNVNRSNLKFILIITPAQDSWLQNLHDAVVNKMRHFLRAWNIPDTSVKVINPLMAKRFNIECRRAE